MTTVAPDLTAAAVGWLEAARQDKANWLIVAEFLDHLRKLGPWAAPEDWNAWLEAQASRTRLLPHYARRMATWRRFMLETPQLRKYLEPADPRWSWEGWTPQLQTGLRGSVVEDLKSLAKALPSEFEAMMANVGREQKLTAAFVRDWHKKAFEAAFGKTQWFITPKMAAEANGEAETASLKAEVRNAASRSLAARRRSGALEAVLELLSANLSQVSPGCPQVHLTRFDFGPNVARTTAIAVGREGACLHFLDGFRVATLTARTQYASLLAEAAHAATRFRHYWLVLVDIEGSVAEAVGELRTGFEERRLANVGVMTVRLAPAPIIDQVVRPRSDAPVPDQRPDALESLMLSLLDRYALMSSDRGS